MRLKCTKCMVADLELITGIFYYQMIVHSLEKIIRLKNPSIYICCSKTIYYKGDKALKPSPKKYLSYFVYYLILFSLLPSSLYYLGYLMKICENVYYFSPVILGIKEGRRKEKERYSK